MTAVASYLDARAHDGVWIVRMEDVDLPRSVPGAADDILRTLDTFGLHWDEPVVYQSARTHLYADALKRLQRDGFAYACSCSRREVAGGAYPGTCRDGVRDPSRPLCWRVREGDFVVQRSDGYFAYQLAVVVDDGAQGITDVVRGADLAEWTAGQRSLQRMLALPEPRYLHVPLVLNADGQKLSKQTKAPALNSAKASELLREALSFLGQEPQCGSPKAILTAASESWHPTCS